MGAAPLQFGVNIFGVGALAEPRALADVARLAEDLGYHSVFVADHVVMPRTLASKYPYSRDGGFPYDPDQDWLDPLVALGYLAGRTTTIRIGTSVTVLPMRHPIITAKQIATADHLSGGRVIFGVGVGWMAEEFRLLGAAFDDRGRRMDEYLMHPKVASVACVAMPDPVLVERVCAYVVCAPGEPLTFDEMAAFLRDKRIAAWKLPERLEIRDSFPMTASGKIQKYQLREEIARLVGQKALIR